MIYFVEEYFNARVAARVAPAAPRASPRSACSAASAAASAALAPRRSRSSRRRDGSRRCTVPRCGRGGSRRRQSIATWQRVRFPRWASFGRLRLASGSRRDNGSGGGGRGGGRAYDGRQIGGWVAVGVPVRVGGSLVHHGLGEEATDAHVPRVSRYSGHGGGTDELAQCALPARERVSVQEHGPLLCVLDRGGLSTTQ